MPSFPPSPGRTRITCDCSKPWQQSDHSTGWWCPLSAPAQITPPFWPRIEACLDALDLRAQVQFLGFVPDEDLRALYQLSQFLIMPTLFESDSFPIYEAWLEGVPVVCSNVCSLPDQVHDAASLFDPHDVQSIAAAITQVSTSPALRESLRTRGYRRLKDFDWAYTARAYRAVFRRAAKRQLGPDELRLLEWDWMREPHSQAEGRS